MGRGQQPGFPLPQIDFYALRAEAYIQLCDFSSAAQNLRRAYSFQPENTNFLERLTFVLYLQVPLHPGPLGLPPAMGLSLRLGLVLTPWDLLVSMSVCPPAAPLVISPTSL